MANFHFIAGDGKQYGPYSTEQMQQFMGQNRLTTQSQVSADGGPWQPASSYPELAVGGSSPPMPPVATPYMTGTPMPMPVKPGPPQSLITWGYVCVGLSLLCCPPLFGLAGIIIGIINCTKGGVGHGIAQIIGSIICSIIGSVLGALSLGGF